MSLWKYRDMSPLEKNGGGRYKSPFATIAFFILATIFYFHKTVAIGHNPPAHTSHEGEERTHHSMGIPIRQYPDSPPPSVSAQGTDKERIKFLEYFSALPKFAKEKIDNSCDPFQSVNDQKWSRWTETCFSRVRSNTFQDNSLQRDILNFRKWREVFPNLNNIEDIDALSDQVEQAEAGIKNCRSNYRIITIHAYEAHNPGRECDILFHSVLTGLRKKLDASHQDFIGDREEFLKSFSCPDQSVAPEGPILECYNRSSEDKEWDRKCIEAVGFKKCRVFLSNSVCNTENGKDRLKALAGELNRKDKSGVAHKCWLAKTQGVQCCANPDQCPTDGAFRAISSQLSKAAPALIQQFAGLKSLTGDHLQACKANLLSNAAGPLSQIQTKTCNDSVKICEETCDEEVQSFKSRIKEALGVDASKAEDTPLEDLLQTAKDFVGDDDKNLCRELDDEEDCTPKTCAHALVYMDERFRKISKEKSLSETTLSHEVLADCSGEIMKSSFGRKASSSSSGMGNPLLPMAGAVCQNPAASRSWKPPPGIPQTPPPPGGSHQFFAKKRTRQRQSPLRLPQGAAPVDDEFITPKGSGPGELTSGWTGTQGDSPGGGAGPGGGGPGGGGYPSGDDRGPMGEEDTEPVVYPESFDTGSGGSGGFGGDGSGAGYMTMAPTTSGAGGKGKGGKYVPLEDPVKSKRTLGSRHAHIFEMMSRRMKIYCVETIKTQCFR